MSDINKWMVARKYAVNEFAAQHIFRGLELDKTSRFWERVRRIIVYRRWRMAGEKTTAAYRHVLDGERAPEALAGMSLDKTA